MILRRSSISLLVAVYAYTVLFVFTRASDNLHDGAGSGSDDGTCVACPAGYYVGDKEHCNCTVCDCPHSDPHCNCSGYCDSNSSCLMCEPGRHADKTGTVVCQECPLGTHNDGYGAVNCTKCAPGMYSNQTGQIQCEKCPPGTNASHEGLSDCMLCPLGYTCSDGGCTNCYPCLAGRSSNDNRTSCQPCALGSYSPGEGHPCETCKRGLICHELGCTECYPCPGGSEPKDGISRLVCDPCRPGTYRSAGVELFCQPCQPGQLQEHYGGENCEECPEKHYCPNPTIKYPCPPDAHCPAGSTTYIFCQVLYQYSTARKKCIPEAMFYVMIGLILLAALLVVIIVVLGIYCHIHRRRFLRRTYKLPSEKIPLAKEPVTEPVYSGH